MAFMIRLVLAATLGANYGIYGPAFELCENRAKEPGSEEYLDSEKYQLRLWDLDQAGNLRGLVTRLNEIRRENQAFQHDHSLRFHSIANDHIVCYSKHSPDFRNIVLTAVNLDPHHAQSGWLELNFDELEFDTAYEVHEMIGGIRFLWQGKRNLISLDPSMPAGVFALQQRLRNEQDFDYYM
jgi:starch synthase (maltosyl-transferring)